MLKPRHLFTIVSFVLLLAACGGHSSSNGVATQDVVPETLSSLAPASGSLGLQSTGTCPTGQTCSYPSLSTSTQTSAIASRSIQSVALTNCPSSVSFCILQGQSYHLTVTWYSGDGKYYPNRVFSMSFTPNEAGITYPVSPNPVHMTPATASLMVTTTTSAAVGQHNIIILGSTNDGSPTNGIKLSYSICNNKTGSCVTPTSTPTCEPKPTRGPNVLKQVPVVDKNGNPIIGASGKALVRPDDGQNFQFYASSALEDTSKPGSFGLDSASNQLWNFKQGGSWDEQRIGSTNGAITTDNFVDISTVNIGVFGAVLGVPQSVMLAAEAAYSFTHHSLQPGDPPAPAPYQWLGNRNYENTLIGYNLVNQGLITYKDWLFCFISPIVALFLKKG